MQILVDIGNTRIKWAEVEDGRLFLALEDGAGTYVWRAAGGR